MKFGRTQHIHFVGIGGIGMSGIAELLLNLGYKVTGSDIKQSSVTSHIEELGGQIFTGHDNSNIAGADVVVYSSAVSLENCELSAAQEKFIPVIPRAEMLSELMRLKYGVAVAGAHGKTTTTSMVASILTKGRLDPTVVIGGRLDIWGGANSKLGQGQILLAEADESDGSFLALSPTISVVTNIDREHLNYYKSMDKLRDTFSQFMNKVPFYGATIACLDDEEIQRLLPGLKKRCITYGLSSQADLSGRDIEQNGMNVSFEVIFSGNSMGRVTVGMPGKHNVRNALAAIGVAMEFNLEIDTIREGLKSLGGLRRRFQIKGERDGVMVIDDYGHHPTEIMAVLETLRESWPGRRIIVIFQPHRYSRTYDLFDKFVLSFNNADVTFVAPIYEAGESPIEGISSETIARGIHEHGHRDVRACNKNGEILSKVFETVLPGDILLTLGAGDIFKIGEDFLNQNK